MEKQKKIINWFNNINDKEECRFVQLDIKDLNEQTVNNAPDLAEQRISILDDYLNIIKYCRMPILYHKSKI